mgnify:CR=1 FL=1
MDITELLAFAVKNKASDLHLSAGLPPIGPTAASGTRSRTRTRSGSKTRNENPPLPCMARMNAAAFSNASSLAGWRSTATTR